MKTFIYPQVMAHMKTCWRCKIVSFLDLDRKHMCNVLHEIFSFKGIKL